MNVGTVRPVGISRRRFLAGAAVTVVTPALPRTALSDAVDSGALININGDGLQPYLEAFMFDIMATMLRRINEDGPLLLLDTPGDSDHGQYPRSTLE